MRRHQGDHAADDEGDRDGPLGGRCGKTKNRKNSGANHASDAYRCRRDDADLSGRFAGLVGHFR